MLKKMIGLLVACFAMSAIVQAQIPNPLPPEFSVTQRWLSWSSDFDIETKQFKLGYIHRKILSWTLEYDFYSFNDQLEAKAKARWFSWGATFDITDPADQLIGTVSQKIFTFFPTFEILAPSGEVLATAKMNFWGTRFTLKDPVNDQELAILSRPFFRLKNNWTVTIENPEILTQKKIDPRLFIIVMAFQSDRELWAAQAENERQNQADYNNQIQAYQPPPVYFKRSTNKSVVAKKNTAPEKTLASVRQELEPYRETLSHVEPTEQDFETVEQVVEKYLSAASDTSEIKSEDARLVNGFTKLMPLLDSDELTPGQKSALFLLMERK